MMIIMHVLKRNLHKEKFEYLTLTKAKNMAEDSPEKRYPAEKEDIDTIITGSDGRDYVVDVVDGMKKWVPYLPEQGDIIIIEKLLPKLEVLQAVKEQPKEKKRNGYQMFVSEMTRKLKEEHKNMSAEERRKIISELWAKEKQR